MMRKIRYKEEENESEERLAIQGSEEAAPSLMVLGPGSHLLSTAQKVYRSQ